MKKVFLSARLRELAARSGRFVEFAGGPGFEALEEKEFARGDFLRQAISKFPEAAPVFSPGSSPSFVAPRGREWRAQFLQWARKRKQSQAVMN